MSEITETNSKENKEKTSIIYKLCTVIGILMCVVLIPVLVINITLIIKSYTNKDEVPSIGGTVPLIVLTDSMYPEIQSGDLIICHTIKPENIKEGDIIAFYDPASEENNKSIVSHRVKEINGSGDDITFITKGDANNTDDPMPVPGDKVVAIYKMSIWGAGNVAMFMQSPKGIIICVVIPIILLVIYDVIRGRISDKKRDQDTEALLKELEELKKAKAEEESEADAKEEN